MSSFCNSVEGFGGTADSSQFVRQANDGGREGGTALCCFAPLP